MKHLDKKTMAFAIAAAIGLSSFGVLSAPKAKDSKMLPGKAHPEIMTPLTPDGKLHWIASEDALTDLNRIRKNPRKGAIKDPEHSYNGVPTFNYIQAPNGNTWFYTSKIERDSIRHPESADWYPVYIYFIKSFEFTIYDENFKQIGTIKDDVTMAEDETQSLFVQLDNLVTDKFFNNDANPEFMVYHAMNTTSYKNRYYYKVYSLGGEKDEKGNDKSLMRWEGRSLNSLRVAPNDWTTDYYLAFTPDDYSSDITIYKKAGWNPEPTPILTYRVPESQKPGDTTDGAYYMTKVVNGKPYFIFSKYEKNWFEDPSDMYNDNLTPNNALIIDVYTMEKVSDNQATKVSTTRIPLGELDNSEELHWQMYSIGGLAGNRDIDMSVNGTPESPAFILRRQYCLASDPDTRDTSFDIIDTQGNVIRQLTELSNGVTMLGDVRGYEPQAMFIELDDAGKYTFHMTNLYSGEEVATINEVTPFGRELTSECNRVPYGADGYKYAFGVIPDPTDFDEEGNDLVCMAWYNQDGSYDRIDRFNVGKNVMYSSVNMSSEVLNPYIFDSDDGMEYAVMVKRTDGNSSSTEFVVTDESGKVYATFSEADGRGSPYSFSVVFGEDINRLQMIYYNWGSDTYNIDMYDLPFAKLGGGSGTEADPYQIASIADLQFVKDDLQAYYVITKDLDGSSFNFKPIQNFSGQIDGQGHNITNLTIAPHIYTGLLGHSAAGARIKNMTFVDPVLNLNPEYDNVSFAAVVAGMSSDLHVEGVNVYNLKTMNSDNFIGTFGGIVAQASTGTTVKTSQVAGTSIDLPGAEIIGGIAGDIRTGSSVIASSFTGNLTGSSTIGGIVGQSFTAENVIDNCHVNANIIGRNTLGGIVGLSNRSQVTHSYVQGSITATNADRNELYSVGGIIGALAPEYEQSANSPVIVSDNIVALRSISAPESNFQEDFKGQKSSVHRIVGSSTSNECEITYDDKWNPIFGDPMTELGIANNYALSSLSIVDDNVEAAENSVEGADVEAIDREFLDETLGFKFGENDENPWHKNSNNDPWLYFESSFIISPSVITVLKEDKFDIDIRFMTEQFQSLNDITADLTAEYDDKLIEMTNEFNFANNVLSIEFVALETGTTEFAVSIGGRTAVVTINVIERPTQGIDDVIDSEDNFKIIYSGSLVSAEGSYIEVYNANGVKVVSGNDNVNVSELSKGIYVVLASDRNGHRATLKIAR